ncbi:MAG: PAS domain S-box-containing protein [Desulforhopalus sp.]|jgi:PAS domain S-box-containing protein
MVAYTGNKSFSDLRKRAQKFLSEKSQAQEMSNAAVQRLVHELDTYQIELELQNEDLRNLQEELERSRSRYATLYDFAPIAYMTLSDKGMILEANLTSGGLLGIQRGELLNRPFSDFIFQDDQDIFYLHRKQLLASRQQQSYELRLKKKDESLFYGLVETIVQPEDCDSPGQFLITVSDISYRKEAELEKIREVKNRYRAIVMDQNELICRFTPELKITFVNDAYCRFFDIQFNEILNTTFTPDIHVEDIPLVRDQFRQLTSLEPTRTIEYRVHTPDGQLFWLQCCSRALFDLDGNIYKYQTVGRDITQLKITEEKLAREVELRQLFLDALPCIAMLIQDDTRLIVASNKAAVEVGAGRGQHCYNAWGQRDSPCTWCRASLDSEKEGPSNDQFWFNDICWDAYWVPLQDGLYLHYFFDITEKQKNREALMQAHIELEHRVQERTLELQQSHKQLLHSEKLGAIGSLSASIAHEFNNPLQSVMTVIKGIGQYVPMEKKETYLLDLALQECDRMKRLIADLRDFSRLSSDQMIEVDLHAILDGLLLLSKKEFSSRKIEIIKKYSGTLPAVMAVADQMKQVFLNLLNNTADACKSGGVIFLTTETVGEKEVVVHIEDNGIGMSSHVLGKIFEPFFTTKPEVKGTGLGLTVSYGIIKKHGGSIEVQSEVGKGSTFSVILPIDGVYSERQIDIAG